MVTSQECVRSMTLVEGKFMKPRTGGTKRTSDLHRQRVANNPAIRRPTEHLQPTKP